MKTKTCVECHYMLHKYTFEVCTHSMTGISMFDVSCKHFTPLTNGDKIRKGGNRESAEFLWKLYNGHICSFCVFLVADDDRKTVICKRPPDKTCTDGIEAWLNAPAESEESEG